MRYNKVVVTLFSVLSCIVFSGICRTAFAGVSNPGFESNDFSFWTLAGEQGPDQGIYSSFASAGNPTLYPVEGSYFAAIQPSEDAPSARNSVPKTSFLLQDIQLSKGDTVSGWAAFLAADEMPNNDYAFITLKKTDSITLFNVWQRDVAAAGDYGLVGWEPWSWSAPESGTYSLTMGVANLIDNKYSSIGFFDGMGVTAAPEPLSVSLFLLGAGALALRRRR